ncbi:MAG: peptidoglycan-associated lipoprotein Pal [Rhizobacter sp.]
MNAIRYVLVVAASAVFLTACGSKVKLDDRKAGVSNATQNPVGGTAGSGTTSGGGASTVTSVDLTKGQTNEAQLQRVVYFDFDSFVVKDEFRSTIDAHAKILTGDRNKRVSIEGHTDERGGREYNLALGQKRAEAVQRSLILLGASEKQIEAVSFGKERPAVSGSDEAAWAQNRRAELKTR